MSQQVPRHTHPRLIIGLVTHQHPSSHDHQEQHLAEFTLVTITLAIWNGLSPVMSIFARNCVRPCVALQVQPVHCWRGTALMADKHHIPESTLSVQLMHWWGDWFRVFRNTMSKKDLHWNSKNKLQSNTKPILLRAIYRNATCPYIMPVKFYENVLLQEDFAIWRWP